MVRTRCCSTCWVNGSPPTWLVVCGAVIVQIGFGVYPGLVKKFAASATVSTHPLIFSFYRDVGAFPVIFLCSFVAERKVMIPRRFRTILVFALLGFLGMFISQVMYVLGIYWVGPDVASAFQPLVPVVTAVLAILSCTEKLHSWGKLVGILLAAGGAVEIALTGLPDDADSSRSHIFGLRIAGYVALCVQSCSSSCYLLLQKRLIFSDENCRWRDYPVAVTAYSYFFGAVFIGLSTIYFAAKGQSSIFLIARESLVALVYAIFISSAMCYILMTWANMHLPSTILTAFWPLQVLVAVVSTYLLTGEQLAPYQYFGAVMLIVALFLVLLSNHMDERLAEGKSVVRLDTCCRGEVPTDQDADENRPLLESSNASGHYSGVAPDHSSTSVKHIPIN